MFIYFDFLLLVIHCWYISQACLNTMSLWFSMEGGKSESIDSKYVVLGTIKQATSRSPVVLCSQVMEKLWLTECIMKSQWVTASNYSKQQRMSPPLFSGSSLFKYRNEALDLVYWCSTHWWSADLGDGWFVLALCHLLNSSNHRIVES